MVPSTATVRRMRSRSTLGARLRTARGRAFVGRTAERELFRQAVTAQGEPPFTVLHVHGPGGIGKSALLRMFAGSAEGAEVVRLDGRAVAPDRDAVRAAVAPLRTTARRGVLLVDTYELLAPLDAWIRDDLLPGLPPDVVVVLAGRHPPAPGWTADPGWRELVRVLPLAPLPPAESAQLLGSSSPRVLAFCSGYPLALALAREIGADAVPERLTAPDVVGELVGRLVDVAPGREHRRALQVAAWARVTTEALLREVLGVDDAGALFDWLRAQPYVESGPGGVHPHDVVREVLVADLRWRDPDTTAALLAALRRSVLAAARSGREGPRGRAILDLLFSFRHDPVARAFFDWDAFGAVPGEPYRPGDRAGVEALLVRHAGAEGAVPLRRWLDEQPAAFTVCRDGDAVRGVAVWLALHEAAPAAVAADPVAAAAVTWAGSTAGDVMMMRFLADRDAGEGPSPAFDAAAVGHLRHVLTRPGLDADFCVTTDPDGLGPFFRHIGYAHELDVPVGDRSCAVFCRDWRRPPARSIWSGLTAPRTAPVTPADIRTALRDLHRPDLLARHPLAADGGPDALRARLLGAVEGLRTDPRDDRLHRVLDRTYLRPAPTQERAAEVLGLPFSTYRRHLGAAIARVATALHGGRGQEVDRERPGE